MERVRVPKKSGHCLTQEDKQASKTRVDFADAEGSAAQSISAAASRIPAIRINRFLRIEEFTLIFCCTS